jgi:hypothetical protein
MHPVAKIQPTQGDQRQKSHTLRALFTAYPQPFLLARMHRGDVIREKSPSQAHSSKNA